MGKRRSRNRGPLNCGAAVYDALFALAYDSLFRGAEAHGLSALRAGLISQARGRTIEIGAGTGLNGPHYPSAVTELILTDPSKPMLRQLARNMAERGVIARIVEAPGDRVPFEAEGFDTVVVTLVLCTARAPVSVLREARRLLAPGGTLLFLEHVRSSEPKLARWQDRLSRPWRLVANGCVCNRSTETMFAKASLRVPELRRAELRDLGPLVRPLIFGAATRER